MKSVCFCSCFCVSVCLSVDETDARHQRSGLIDGCHWMLRKLEQALHINHLWVVFLSHCHTGMTGVKAVSNYLCQKLLNRISLFLLLKNIKQYIYQFNGCQHWVAIPFLCATDVNHKRTVRLT